MNINYSVGNTVKSSMVSGTADYKFPKYGDTCEWASDEVRSYDNYLRPVKNLFDNDRALQQYSNLIGQFLVSDKGATSGCIIAGCTPVLKNRMVGTTNTYYVSIEPGVFYDYRRTCYNSARCELAAKQIENSLFYKEAVRASVVLEYIDGKYRGIIKTDLAEYKAGFESNITDAISLLLALNNQVQFINQDYKLEDFILTPIFNVTTSTFGKDIWFNGSEMKYDTYVAGNGNVSFCTIKLEDNKYVLKYDNVRYLKSQSVQTVSDSKVKENFSEFNESAVDIINSVQIWNYNYIGDSHHKIGIKAENTHEYISTEEKNVLDHANAIGLLFKAVQELSAENKALREEINEIKSAK